MNITITKQEQIWRVFFFFGQDLLLFCEIGLTQAHFYCTCGQHLRRVQGSAADGRVRSHAPAADHAPLPLLPLHILAFMAQSCTQISIHWLTVWAPAWREARQGSEGTGKDRVYQISRALLCVVSFCMSSYLIWKAEAAWDKGLFTEQQKGRKDGGGGEKQTAAQTVKNVQPIIWQWVYKAPGEHTLILTTTGIFLWFNLHSETCHHVSESSGEDE